jgi:acetylornithine deacetylase/succinyl-diaminopimelate desuccinylase-like protein
MVEWAKSLHVPDFRCEFLEEEGRSPFIFGVAHGTLPGTVLLNFHFDKLPPAGNWSTDPHELTEKEGWFLGNGVVDDGYAFYLFVSALALLGTSERKSVVIIGGSDEFVDMPYWIERVSPRFP